MSDRELIQLAAKAAGIDMTLPSVAESWNPYADDGDALRLAADTRLRIDFNYHTGTDKQKGIGAWPPGDNSPYPPFWTMYGKKPDLDVRYTIVRAAAHVGKSMP